MSGLQVYHHSQQEYFRQPFGAQPCGHQVVLRIMVKSDVPPRECILHLWAQEQELLQPMEIVSRDGATGTSPSGVPFIPDVIFETRVNLPHQPGLVWYFFKLNVDGQTFFYHNNLQELGGEGVLSQQKGSSFQITVYRPAPVPLWFKTGTMYQIYVDRFFNGNPKGEVLNAKEKSLIHAHWGDTPFYIKDKEGRILRWTFFGGNLQGVIEKLPYLEEMGITVLYFNPIFEAASNHKYDTGDYLKLDPMYGDLATFVRLIQVAEKAGMQIILDGVFSHTGCDSRYFNKYGNYPEVGAFQSEDSPYYSWYKLDKPGGECECWWGVEDLPNVNEMEPSYQDFIFGSEDSVVRFWLRKGVKGWRLDVADELPGEFIKKLRQAIHEVDPDAILIGEVWEDASRKVSYGERREYFLGDELDSVMNYPLREILLDFFLGTKTAPEAYEGIMSLYENYPPENFRAAMNVIGSHDRIRGLTLLGDAPAEKELTLQEREDYRLSPEAKGKGIARLKLLVLLQMTLPGVPCVYYGDEAGVEGYSDPFNRGTFPWGRENTNLQQWYQRMIRLRNEYAVLQEGTFHPFYIGKDVFGFRSTGEKEEIIVCVNRSAHEAAKIQLVPSVAANENIDDPDWKHPLVLELLSGAEIALSNLSINVELGPMEGKVLYLRPQPMTTKLAASAPAAVEGSCGILLHLTSLPSPWGIGDMGQSARKFVDFLAATGQSYWQILPLNPVGLGFSPYQSPSVMAGNHLLISPELLQEAGLLRAEDLAKEVEYLKQRNLNPNKVDYPVAAEVKERLLHQAWKSFQSYMKEAEDKELIIEDNSQEEYLSYQGYQRFLSQSALWLDDYCLFMALKKSFNNKPWTEWEPGIAFREEKALEAVRDELQEDLAYQGFLQYTFFCQWQKLKDYANKKGVKIIGDLPIYVAADSCDTWVNRELFKLDSKGQPTSVAGVPPDYFSDKGQHWGNPIYNWRKMEQEGYAWWKDRMRQVLTNYDYLRLDHFRGFEAYWEIPAGEETAIKGRWLKGPGKRLFESLEQEFGLLPFLAEDLGYLTPEVHNLRNIFGFPGMKVYQFETESDIAPDIAPISQPSAHLEHLEHFGHWVLYSGTHDNDTLLGWIKQNGEQLQLAGKVSLEEVALRKALKEIYRSNAALVIVPMQDILGLDSWARMNTPGTIHGNWSWRMKKNDVTESVATGLRRIARHRLRKPPG